jgi:hypothetical protein
VPAAPLTLHQRQYWAWLLQRKAASDSVESLASTLVDAQVDLNPHQVEAALFACQNPLSKGVSPYAITRKLAADHAEWTSERVAAHQNWMANQATAVWRVAQLS